MTTETKPEQQRLENKKGFTLTEIAIVLGIMGLILGAIWTAASAVYSNQRTAKAQTAILQTVQGIRSLYAGQNAIEVGDRTSDLIDAGVIPSDLVFTDAGGAKSTTGPFPNGTFHVDAVEASGFTVVVTNVPRSNCINLITGLAGNNRDPGLFAANAQAQAAFSAGEGEATADPLVNPLSPADASGFCSNDLNKMHFAFTLK